MRTHLILPPLTLAVACFAACGSSRNSPPSGSNSSDGGSSGSERSSSGGSSGSTSTGGSSSGGNGTSSGATSSGSSGGSSSSGGSGAGSSGSSGTASSGSSGSSGSTSSSGSGGSEGGVAGPEGPCDIYQSAGTPCAGAHSTTRALYAAYTGPLYQVQRASDKATKDIPVGPGGYANSSVQDTFCQGTSCTIPIIYDQSPNGNHLRVTWYAHWLPMGGNPAVANAAKITMAGNHTVYGIKVTGFGPNIAYRTGMVLSGTAAVTSGSATVTFSTPQTLAANVVLMFAAETASCPTYSCPTHKITSAINGATTATLTAPYSGTSSAATVAWDGSTKGVAIGDDSEAMYSVFDGTRFAAFCCFDYGNAEINAVDDGNATMEAIYWGSDTQFGQSGGGNGPWVAADLENGMYEGGGAMCPVSGTSANCHVTTNTSVTGFPFVTAMLKGLTASACPAGLTSTGCFELKAGNSTGGKLAVKYDATTSGYGARPPNYSPQKKEGAIILGTGGDGSQGGTGTWFEGAITLGAPPDSADDAVQANIVAAGYPAQ